MASASGPRESRNSPDTHPGFDPTPGPSGRSLIDLTFIIDNQYTEQMTNATGLSILNAAELLAADIAPRGDLLAPLLASDGAALVYGSAGIGKSFFALSLAWAVAGGGSFLGWQSPRPHRVLYVDGELGAAALRERLALFGPPPAGLAICPHDLTQGPLLDLGEDDGLLRLMAAWNQPELVVLDTLTSLAGLASGDGERWDRLQQFLLHQRHHRRAMLLVHHANRDGAMRGTTRHEDALDLVLALRRPDDGPPAGNARFEIHVEKARRKADAPLVPILAELETDAGSSRAQWRWEPAGGNRFERAVALLNRGHSARQAWEALGISRTSLFRIKA